MSDNTDNPNQELDNAKATTIEATGINSQVPTVNLEEELKQSFIDYAMSFIVDSGAILGYLFGLHNKMHKSISREKLMPRIVRNHHRKK